MIASGDESHRFVIHDRDRIYSEDVDRTVAAMGLTVLKTPIRSPQANAFCERLIGTIRRECLDFVIPLNERPLRCVLQQWIPHDMPRNISCSVSRFHFAMWPTRDAISLSVRALLEGAVV